MSHKSFVAATMLLSTSVFCGNLNANDSEIALSPAPTDSEAHTVFAAKAIQWSDLAPENGKPFFDPFAKLSGDQIADLSYVVRVRRLIAGEKIESDGEDAKEAAKLTSRLERQGVDIGWLIAQRDRVRQIRGLQVENVSNSISNSLQDQKVSLTGFVIPLTVDEGRLTQFFLVPTVAACSHEDPPPRLQVVFVSTQQGIAPPGRQTPVRVTGAVAAEATSRSTVNASGRVMVHSAYAMSSPEIQVFQLANNSSDSSKQ
jgi:hypothetical protein